MASVADIPGLAEWSALVVALAPGEDAQPRGGDAQPQEPPEGTPAKFSGFTPASPVNPHWGLRVTSKGKIASLKRVMPGGNLEPTLRSTRAVANNKRRKLAQAIVNQPFCHHKFSQKMYIRGIGGRKQLSGERRLHANALCHTRRAAAAAHAYESTYLPRTGVEAQLVRVRVTSEYLSKDNGAAEDCQAYNVLLEDKNLPKELHMTTAFATVVVDAFEDGTLIGDFPALVQQVAEPPGRQVHTHDDLLANAPVLGGAVGEMAPRNHWQHRYEASFQHTIGKDLQRAAVCQVCSVPRMNRRRCLITPASPNHPARVGSGRLADGCSGAA